VIFSQIKIAKIENDFQSNQIKIVSYFKFNLAVLGGKIRFFLNGNSSMNFLTFMVGNPSHRLRSLCPSATEDFLEKSSCNYVINNAFFFGGGGYFGHLM
jgi:hypothetical protein